MSIGYNIYKIIPFNRLKRLFINRIVCKKGGAESNLLREIFLKDHNIICGYGTYGGCFDLSNIPPNVTFGNYCSVANGVKIFRANHPLSYITSHPISYNPIMGVVEKDLLVRPHLEIGHDVWIGANAIILPTVKKIGNGAIIGAGSVVTKDIEPYTINVGNPSKSIKKRFNPSQIEFLEEAKWWTMNMAELATEWDNLENKLKALA